MVLNVLHLYVRLESKLFRYCFMTLYSLVKINNFFLRSLDHDTQSDTRSDFDNEDQDFSSLNKTGPPRLTPDFDLILISLSNELIHIGYPRDMFHHKLVRFCFVMFNLVRFPLSRFSQVCARHDKILSNCF